jgi:hypothetical protein
MSTIFISDIVGTGTYAVPSSDLEIADADLAFATLLSGVLNFTFERVMAWVKDGASSGGAEGNRILNCFIAGAEYSNEDCTSEANADTLFSGIRAALIGPHGGSSILTVGGIEFNMVAYGGGPG